MGLSVDQVGYFVTKSELRNEGFTGKAADLTLRAAGSINGVDRDNFNKVFDDLMDDGGLKERGDFVTVRNDHIIRNYDANGNGNGQDNSNNDWKSHSSGGRDITHTFRSSEFGSSRITDYRHENVYRKGDDFKLKAYENSGSEIRSKEDVSGIDMLSYKLDRGSRSQDAHYGFHLYADKHSGVKGAESREINIGESLNGKFTIGLHKNGDKVYEHIVDSNKLGKNSWKDIDKLDVKAEFYDGGMNVFMRNQNSGNWIKVDNVEHSNLDLKNMGGYEIMASHWREKWNSDGYFPSSTSTISEVKIEK
ncbi:MAG: hypothetical protein V4629_09490 [Pseudomonadota bacterium]